MAARLRGRRSCRGQATMELVVIWIAVCVILFGLGGKAIRHGLVNIFNNSGEAVDRVADNLLKGLGFGK